MKPDEDRIRRKVQFVAASRRRYLEMCGSRGLEIPLPPVLES